MTDHNHDEFAAPDQYPCGHATVTPGCGGCDPSAIDFVITDDGVRRPFDPARDLTTSADTVHEPLAVPVEDIVCTCGWPDKAQLRAGQTFIAHLRDVGVIVDAAAQAETSAHDRAVPSPADTEALAEALAVHSLGGWRELRPGRFARFCACGVMLDSSDDAQDSHRLHVADVVARIVADAVSAAQAEALRNAARSFEYDMSKVWGGDVTWISTGTRVADLVADVLREQAAAIEDRS